MRTDKEGKEDKFMAVRVHLFLYFLVFCFLFFLETSHFKQIDPLSSSILSVSRPPPHCTILIAAVVNIAVSCCAPSIIDEKRQE